MPGRSRVGRSNEASIADARGRRRRYSLTLGRRWRVGDVCVIWRSLVYMSCQRGSDRSRVGTDDDDDGDLTFVVTRVTSFKKISRHFPLSNTLRPLTSLKSNECAFVVFFKLVSIAKECRFRTLRRHLERNLEIERRVGRERTARWSRTRRRRLAACDKETWEPLFVGFRAALANRRRGSG